MIFERQRQHRTTVTIDMPDWVYMKKHNLKPAHLIRAVIRDHRAFTEDGGAETTLQMRNKIERLSKLMNGYVQFLEEKGLNEDFLKSQGFLDEN